MSERIFKSHNVSIRIYHLVCPAKYRKVVFDPEVDAVLRDICIEISDCYEIRLSEIGRDRDHVHFLVQSVLTYSPKRLVQLIKSLTAREVFKRVPSVKRQLWGGQFWSDAISWPRSASMSAKRWSVSMSKSKAPKPTINSSITSN